MGCKFSNDPTSRSACVCVFLGLNFLIYFSSYYFLKNNKPVFGPQFEVVGGGLL